MKKILRRVALLTLVAFGAIAQQTCNNGLGGGGNGLPSGGSVGQCLVNTAPGAGGWNSCVTGAVSTTGSPAAGELTKFLSRRDDHEREPRRRLHDVELADGHLPRNQRCRLWYLYDPELRVTANHRGHDSRGWPFHELCQPQAQSFTAASGVALTATGISGQNAAALPRQHDDGQQLRPADQGGD